jgi:hypothetical protein
MSCEECIEMYEMAPSSKKPPCKECKGNFKDVIPENHLIIGLCEKYTPLILDGESVSIDGLKEVIRMEDLEDIRDDVMILIPLYLKTVLRTIRNRELRPMNKVK